MSKIIHLGTIENPPGTMIGKCSYGFAIFATKDFVKGEKVYEGTYSVLPDDETCFSYTTPEGLYIEEDPNVHYPLLYGKLYRNSDSCLNHSCDPNTTFQNITTPSSTTTDGVYTSLASRDIKALEELTTNYLLYYWNFQESAFECHCGSSNCNGLIAGFAYLPPEIQEKLLPEADVTIQEIYLREKEKKDS